MVKYAPREICGLLGLRALLGARGYSQDVTG
jgi:hypothetical protein